MSLLLSTVRIYCKRSTVHRTRYILYSIYSKSDRIVLPAHCEMSIVAQVPYSTSAGKRADGLPAFQPSRPRLCGSGLLSPPVCACSLLWSPRLSTAAGQRRAPNPHAA